MKRFLKNVLFLAFFALIAIFVMNSVYKRIGYGYFKKAISRSGVTFFTRDNKIKYSDMNSYKIENKDYNNATFYKKIKLKKNTPYKITCMIKTEGVEILNKRYENSGAKISILDTIEQSEAVTGTKDWQKVTLMFNSKQNEELNVGFMLGGDSNSGNVRGTAWFSDLKIEEGNYDEENNWNFACFIFKNVDVNLLDTNYSYSMSNKDINQIESCMDRFKNSCQEMSNNKMSVTYRIIEINEPITELSYDENKGYYIDPKNVSKQVDKYINSENFDHIFVCTRLNDDKSSIPIKNWIGLGGMEYREKGFSNIRMPTLSTSTQYIYNEKNNQFPEEVFIHEFLHTLERNAEKFGYSVPALHDNENYGYSKTEFNGLYNWYKDYMNKNIGTEKMGLDEEIYMLKPLDDDNFINSKDLNEFEDVKNIWERLKLVLKTMQWSTNS
ncbi:MAG: hypothetical protein IJH12_08405 [Clostridia bacterium]|nr:hypothetical protein [Clostridia bacterium]